MTVNTAGKVVIGTRGSKLALVQTHYVRDLLLARYPGLEVEIEIITTKGDVLTDRPLAEIGGRGLFVTQIEVALRSERIDLAVHSAKDLPSELAPGMAIAGWLQREDPRDVLVSRAGTLDRLPFGARVGTSSPRRVCALLAKRPDLRVADVRGNVDTRLRKLHCGEYDALVLAAAGLIRLGLEHEITEWLAPDVMLPAVGQGALAVEVRADDQDIVELIAPLTDPATATAVMAERAFLAAIGGGCSVPIAAHGMVCGETLTLTGMIGATDGRMVTATTSGPTNNGEALGAELAASLLANGGTILLETQVPQLELVDD